MKNQTFVCGTMFHIYISILKSLHYKKHNVKTLLIVNDHTPDIDKTIELIKEKEIFDFVIKVPTFSISYMMRTSEQTFKKMFFRNQLSIQYVENNSEINLYHYFIENSEINLFYHLGLSNTYFILRYKNSFFRMLEDGYRNYNQLVTPIKVFKRKYILNTVLGEGRDKQVKEIEVQYPEKLPENVKHKGVKLDLKKIQESLSEKEKNLIFSIFLQNTSINVNTNKNLLLITQPLSEDKRISEKYKVKLYQKILDKYSKDYNVYLKTHPRELTDYTNLLKTKFQEIPRSFPLELLDFMEGIKFDLGITIFSSALYNLNCIENKLFLGIEYMKKSSTKDYETVELSKAIELKFAHSI